MSLRLVAVLVLVSFTLVGCFRQAGDNFQSVDSQSSGAPPIVPVEETEAPLPVEEMTEEATEEATEMVDEPPVTVIVPGDTTPTDAVLPSPTLTDIPLEPTATNTTEPTAAQVQQVVPSSTPTDLPPTIPPAQNEIPTTVPTATEVIVVTPGAPVQVEQPTNTPEATATSEDDEESEEGTSTSTNGIVTPTGLPEAVDAECTYTVRAGDNLFRIALRNGTTVDALQSFNSLPTVELIQPGQVLNIPNCVAEDDEADTDSQSTDDDSDSPLRDSGIIHAVQSGETLGGIARRYGTTVDAILELNDDIANADVLTVGQEIAIPE